MRAGYKMTDLGEIPNDWECVSVADLIRQGIIEKPMDGNHGEIHPKSSEYVDYGIPFVMANNVQNGFVDLEKCKFITKERADGLRNGFSIAGDVLLTHKATIGNTAIVGSLSTEYIMLTPQVTYYRVRDFQKLDNRYLRQYFDGSAFQNMLKNLSGGGTRSYIGIGAQVNLLVILPPLPEQCAIAANLSDVDALLNSLDALIAKKRLIKQSAMQELLRPKDGWKVLTVAEIAGGASNIVDGPFGSNLKNSDYVSNGVPVLQGLNITDDQFVWKEVRYISPQKAKDLYRSNAQVGDLLSVKIGSVGYSAIIDNLDRNDFAIIPANLLRTRIQNPNSDTLFVYYLLTSNFAKKKLRDLAGNTAQPAIGLTGFRNLSFSVPVSLKEQTAIAEILSDMDAEISALEQKREKTRLLKQGMMQELLTGRIRLV